MARLQGLFDSGPVTDGTTSRVHDPCAFLDGLEQLLVEETACALVERTVDGDHVTLGDHFLQTLDTAGLDGLSGVGG